MDIISIINSTSPCNFINDSNKQIILKNLNSKYIIKNILDSNEEIECKLIKNQKIIRSWSKKINTNFDKSILLKFKIKELKCLKTKFYSYLIEINKNIVDEFGLLSINIFQIIPIGSFNSKLLFINTFTSQF
jgi:hypothetical protein